MAYPIKTFCLSFHIYTPNMKFISLVHNIINIIYYYKCNTKQLTMINDYINDGIKKLYQI